MNVVGGGAAWKLCIEWKCGVSIMYYAAGEDKRSKIQASYRPRAGSVLEWYFGVWACAIEDVDRTSLELVISSQMPMPDRG